MSYIKEIIKVANQIEYKIAQLSLTPQELPQAVPFNIGIGDAVSRNLNKGFHSGPAMMQHGHTAKSPTLRPVTPTPPTKAVSPGVQAAPSKAPKAHDPLKGGGTSLGQIWEGKVKQTKDPAALQQLLTQRLAEIDRQQMDPTYKKGLKDKAIALVESVKGATISTQPTGSMAMTPQQRVQGLQQANYQRYHQPNVKVEQPKK